LSWQQPAPFLIDIEVLPEHIDALGHVNNVVYVGWLEDCAWRHSRSLGLGLDEYRRLDRAMAVLRHEIDYLASARLGEHLQMGTWIIEAGRGLRMTRQFQLLRPADGATLLRAQTTFACIELSSGRPRRIPETFAERYGSALVHL